MTARGTAKPEMARSSVIEYGSIRMMYTVHRVLVNALQGRGPWQLTDRIPVKWRQYFVRFSVKAATHQTRLWAMLTTNWWYPWFSVMSYLAAGLKLRLQLR